MTGAEGPPRHWLTILRWAVLFALLGYLSLSRLILGPGDLGPAWLQLGLVGLLVVVSVAHLMVVGPAPKPPEAERPRSRPPARWRRISPSVPLAARSPNAWQDDQLAFRRAYAADPRRFERAPVVFRWWTRTDDLEGGGGIFAVAWAARFFYRLANNTTSGVLVALYRPDAPDGSDPFLCFEVYDDTFGYATDGEGEGVLVGEVMRNGTLLLETGGRTVIPQWNPTIEAPDAPGR